MMDLNNFSLIYPSFEARQNHYKGINLPKIDMFVLEELGMLDFIDLRNSELSEYFTADRKVIEYRMETFSDMLENPETPTHITVLYNDVLDKENWKNESFCRDFDKRFDFLLIFHICHTLAN